MNKYLRFITLPILSLLLAALTIQGQTEQPTENISLYATQHKLGRLAQGLTSGQAVFPIDRSNTVTVEVIASIGGLNVSILTPGGQVLDPNTVPTVGGTFTTIDGSAQPASNLLLLPQTTQGFHYIFQFPWQGNGDYTVRFQGPQNLAQEVPVITEVLTDSPVAARLFASAPTMVAGDSEVLTAALFNGQAPLAGANISVSIHPPSGPLVNLNLRDDGAEADNAAGDGLYNSEFTPSVPGIYYASARITGTTPAGISYTRQSATSFTVIPGTSRLTGGVSDQGSDDDGDGLLNRVVFNVPTNTTRAGNYRAFVHLKTAQGQSIVRSAEANLPTGAAVMQVSFEATAFTRVGENGPYTIELVELLFLDDRSAQPADALRDVGQTNAYLLTQFQRPPLSFTGHNTATGIDTNGNGKFDLLRIQSEVFTASPGFYQWSATLVDRFGREIDFYSGSAFFSLGNNNMTLTFSGSKIGQNGRNGPYSVRSVLLFGAGRTLLVDRLFDTQAFSVTQFENGVEEQTGDAIAPTTTVARSVEPNPAGWNNSDVRLTLSATDNPGGSGVREITYSATGAQSIAPTTVNASTASFTLSAEGTTSVSFFARDNAGNAEAARTITLKIDKTPPLVNIASPAESHLLNQPVVASYNCRDDFSGLVSCQGSVPDGAALDTSSVGLKRFSVTATDIAGNSVTRQRNYAVTYNVQLRYDPTKANTSGSTVPVKLLLTDARGNNVSAEGVVVTALAVSLKSAYAPGEVQDAGQSNPDDNFRFINVEGTGGYIFNLKTTGLTTGTYVLVFKAGDDPVLHQVEFQIK